MELLLLGSIQYYLHQKEGIRWMIEKETIGTSFPTMTTIRGGLQCDDMGLGKTIQIVGCILNNSRENTLIITPLAVIEQWKKILDLVSATFHIYRVSKKGSVYSWQKETETNEGSSKRSIFLCHFDVIQRHPYLITKRWWDRIVVDEAHRLCGKGSLFQILQTVRSTIRWGITGTPLVNKNKDVWSLLEFIGVPIPSTKKTEKETATLLRSVMLRRSMGELRELHTDIPIPPEPLIIDKPVVLSEKETNKYKEVSNTEYNPSVLKLLRLRQVSVHPWICNKDGEEEPEWNLQSMKIRSVCRELIESYTTHKCIVFCQFLKEINIIREALLLEKMPQEAIEEYSGSLSSKQRKIVIERAKKEGCRILLMQIQAGGVGLNLQEFDTCIFTGLWWTPSLVNQAIGRCVRIGQERVVRVVYLSLFLGTTVEENEGIDDKIKEIVEKKKKMLEDVLTIDVDENPQ